jgi:hypothetical protein
MKVVKGKIIKQMLLRQKHEHIGRRNLGQSPKGFWAIAAVLCSAMPEVAFAVSTPNYQTDSTK